MTEQIDKTVLRKMYTYATFIAPKEVEDKFLSADINKVHIVFFNPEEKFPVKGFYKIVARKNNKSGADFYGMKSGKYGARVPKDATHMALAIFGKRKIERLYTMDLPRPLSRTIVEFGKDSTYVMHVRRSNQNLFLIIGQSKVKAVNTDKKLHKDINEKWVQL